MAKSRKIVYKKDPVTGQMVRSDLDAATVSTPMGVASEGGTAKQQDMVAQRATNLGDAATSQPTQATPQPSNLGGAPSPQTPPTPPAPQPAAPAADLLTQLRYGGKSGQAAADAPAMSGRAQELGSKAAAASDTLSNLSGLDAYFQNQATAALGAAPSAGPSGISEGGGSVDVASGQATLDAPTAHTDADVTAALASGLTQAMKSAGDFSVTPEALKAIGYTDESIAELEKLIGRTPIGMTAANLREAVRSAGDQFANQAATEQAVAEDLTLGRNAREAAEAVARETRQALGGTPEEIDSVIESLSDVDTIDFFGKKLTIEDIISDSNNTSLITAYLTGDEAAKAQMREQSPELAKWIDDNQATVKEALTKQDAAEVAAYETEQKKMGWYENAKKFSNWSTEESSKWVNAALEGSALAAAVLDDPTGVAFQVLSGLSGNKTFMNDLLKGEFGDLEDLKDLGLFSPDNISNPQFLNHFKDFADAYDGTEALLNDRRDNTPEELLPLLFPEGTTMKELTAMLRNPQAFQRDPMLKWAQLLFDSDKDGKLDLTVGRRALDAFKEELKTAMTKGEALPFDLNAPSALAKVVNNPRLNESIQAFGDGMLTPEEASGIEDAIRKSNRWDGLSSVDLQGALAPYLFDASGKPKMGEAAVPILNALGNAAINDVDKKLDAMFGVPKTAEGDKMYPLFADVDYSSPAADQFLLGWGPTFQAQEDNLGKAKAALNAELQRAPAGTMYRQKLMKGLSNIEAMLDKLGAVPEAVKDAAPAKVGDTFTLEGYLKNKAGEAGQGLAKGAIGGLESALDATAGAALEGDVETLAKSMAGGTMAPILHSPAVKSLGKPAKPKPSNFNI